MATDVHGFVHSLVIGCVGGKNQQTLWRLTARLIFVNLFPGQRAHALFVTTVAKPNGIFRMPAAQSHELIPMRNVMP